MVAALGAGALLSVMSRDSPGTRATRPAERPIGTAGLLSGAADFQSFRSDALRRAGEMSAQPNVWALLELREEVRRWPGAHAADRAELDRLLQELDRLTDEARRRQLDLDRRQLLDDVTHR